MSSSKSEHHASFADLSLQRDVTVSVMMYRVELYRTITDHFLPECIMSSR